MLALRLFLNISGQEGPTELISGKEVNDGVPDLAAVSDFWYAYSANMY